MSSVDLVSGVYSEKLMCRFISMNIVNGRTLVIHIPAGNVTDMNGAVNIAEFLSDEIYKVLVIVGGQEDILYQKISDKWEAFDLLWKRKVANAN